ncbi:MAG: hypothetical protein LR015_08725 [Verrucomicrobia bacterium]|nr:hypothetical protein [Verrucomicrobiota bacterium]
MNIYQQIKALESEIEALGGYIGSPSDGGLCPPEIKRQFLQHVLGSNKSDPVDEQVRVMDPWRELNERMQLPPEAELDDRSLKQKLWEIIDFLCQYHVRIAETEHLSDRELYRELCNEVLRKPIELYKDPRKRQTVYQLSSRKPLDLFDEDPSRYHPEGRERDSRICKRGERYLTRRYPKMKTFWRMAARTELPRENCFQITHQADGTMMLSVSR